MRLAASPVPVSSSSNSLVAPPSISFVAGAHAIGLWKDAVELTRLDRVAGRGEPGDHPGPCLLLGRARRTALLLLLREIRRVRRHQYSQPEGCRRGKPSADLDDIGAPSACRCGIRVGLLRRRPRCRAAVPRRTTMRVEDLSG